MYCKSSDRQTDRQHHCAEVLLPNHASRLATPSQVPLAVKALYASPLPDVLRSSPLSESLLTAEELVEWWRWEEERERREFVAPPQPTLTQDQDEVCVCV